MREDDHYKSLSEGNVAGRLLLIAIAFNAKKSGSQLLHLRSYRGGGVVWRVSHDSSKVTSLPPPPYVVGTRLWRRREEDNGEGGEEKVNESTLEEATSRRY